MHELRQQRWLAWLCLVAVMLGLLLPSVGRALAANTDSLGWVQVCSAAGERWINLSAAEPSSESPGQASGDSACPWCVFKLLLGLPPLQGQVHLASSPSAALPGLDAAPLHGAPRWVFAPSRAPPHV